MASASGSIADAFSKASSFDSCGTDGDVASSGSGVDTSEGVGAEDAAADDDPDVGGCSSFMIRFSASSTNFACPPRFLRFDGGGGLTSKPCGVKAPLARNTTSRQRLQSSSSSYSLSDKVEIQMEETFLTFIFLKRVMTRTASLERGTGDPMPMSIPVSRGSSFA